MRDAALAKDAAYTTAWSVGVLAAFAVVSLLFQGVPWAFVSANLSAPSASGNLYDVSGPSWADLLAGTLTEFGWNLAFSILPFGIGVFLVLWLLLPVRYGMSFARVVVHGLVASLAGAVLAVIAGLLTSSVHYVGWGMLTSVLSFVSMGVRQAPVVILVLVARHLIPRRAQP
jgi:hypothetical protein